MAVMVLSRQVRKIAGKAEPFLGKRLKALPAQR
jgi:hypothetical protein